MQPLNQQHREPLDRAALIEQWRELFNLPAHHERYREELSARMRERFTEAQRDTIVESYDRREKFWLPENERRATADESRLRIQVIELAREVKTAICGELMAAARVLLHRMPDDLRHEMLGRTIVELFGAPGEETNRRFGGWLLNGLKELFTALDPKRLDASTRVEIERAHRDAVAMRALALESLLFRALTPEYVRSPEFTLMIGDLAAERYTPDYAALHFAHELMGEPILKRSRAELRQWPPLQNHVLATLIECIRGDIPTDRERSDLIRDAVREFGRPDFFESTELRGAVYADIERLCAAGDLEKLAGYAALVLEQTPAKGPVRKGWIELGRSFSPLVEPLVVDALRQRDSYPAIAMVLRPLYTVFCPGIRRHPVVTAQLMAFFVEIGNGTKDMTVWASAALLAAALPPEERATLAARCPRIEEVRRALAIYRTADAPASKRVTHSIAVGYAQRLLAVLEL